MAMKHFPPVLAIFNISADWLICLGHWLGTWRLCALPRGHCRTPYGISHVPVSLCSLYSWTWQYIIDTDNLVALRSSDVLCVDCRKGGKPAYPKKNTQKLDPGVPWKRICGHSPTALPAPWPLYSCTLYNTVPCLLMFHE